MRLADVIGQWIGKVEVVLAGADEDLRDGEDALAGGDAMRARAAAHRVLVRAPESPLGLALLADACQAAHLDAELTLTLEELARRAPSRAEVWVRLSRARRVTGAPDGEVRDALVRALTVAESGSEARRDALIGLTDLDLARGDAARAELWLERAAPVPYDGARRTTRHDPDVAVRLAEVRLLRGDAAGANAELQGVEFGPTDGRAALALGRAMAMIGEPAAFAPLVRAMVLDTRGASEALSAAIAHVPSDAQTRVRVHSVVDAKGEQGLARWRAAFARAEGAHEAAREALREAVNAGESAAARPLLDAAIEDCDSQALNAALRAISVDDSDALLADARRLAHALSVDRDRSAEALDAIALVTDSRVSPWAERIAGDIARAWIPASGAPAAWVPLLARLDTHAHAIGDLTSAARVGALSAERSRPVVLAVVGEFNAGKSTFINALIGADIAPTGVLPTTATLHHLRWAPDPFAKVIFATGHDPSERIVALGELRATLAGLDTAAIRRVEIRLPLASLVAVEILDTPGFNAPDARHASVARSAFDEADVAIWLLDATQAIKQSERAVLEEAQRAKLPVQMFVNKSDRLSPKDLQKVMDGVSAALAETEISSWRPPLPFSAKRALAGKLGDAAALEDSGWRAVQALLEDQIVARSDELKERALRRRASSVVGELVAAWRTKIDVERAQAHEASDRAHRAAQVAARIDRDADTTASQLATSLAPHAEAWKRDLELVFIGRDPEAAARDSVLERYRVERALESIAPALARALASLASEAGLTPAQIGPIARAIVRAAASCAPPDIDAMLAGSARAAVATLIEQLSALSVAPSPPTRAGGILRELQAFAAALG